MQTGTLAEGVCFVAGTLVWTAHGMVPIEEIQIGDLVWSKATDSEPPRLRTVTQTFVHDNQQVWLVDVATPDGQLEEIGTTAEHPFWVEGRGWTKAADLQPGDRLSTPLHPWLEVRQVRGSPRVETVYNLEVEEDHTYFAGELRSWVHNQCDATPPRPSLGLDDVLPDGSRNRTDHFADRRQQRREALAKRSNRDSVFPKNADDGALRESRALEALPEQPGRLVEQKTIFGPDGKRARASDGKGRVLDICRIVDGCVTETFEITSPTEALRSRKIDQIDRGDELIATPGTHILGPNGEQIPFESGLRTTIITPP